MTRTGFRCQATGLYRSDCKCGMEIKLSQWQIFLPCSSCQRPVTWELMTVNDSVQV